MGFQSIKRFQFTSLVSSILQSYPTIWDGLRWESLSTFHLSGQIPVNKIYSWPQGQEGTVAEPSEPLDNASTWVCLVIFPFSAINPFTFLPLRSSALPTFLLSPSPRRKEKLLGQGRWAFMQFSIYLPDTVLGILYGLFPVELQKLFEVDISIYSLPMKKRRHRHLVTCLRPHT